MGSGYQSRSPRSARPGVDNSGRPARGHVRDHAGIQGPRSGGTCAVCREAGGRMRQGRQQKIPICRYLTGATGEVKPTFGTPSRSVEKCFGHACRSMGLNRAGSVPKGSGRIGPTPLQTPGEPQFASLVLTPILPAIDVVLTPCLAGVQRLVEAGRLPSPSNAM
jgi:hypothetical protein